jgi:hypothetical protein
VRWPVGFSLLDFTHCAHRKPSAHTRKRLVISPSGECQELPPGAAIPAYASLKLTSTKIPGSVVPRWDLNASLAWKTNVTLLDRRAWLRGRP